MIILFILDGLHRGGREQRFVQLIKGLNEKGHKDLYLISSLDCICYPEIYNYDINIIFISRKEKHFYSRLIKSINDISPDIVQTWSLISTFHYNTIKFFCKCKPKHISSFIADCNYSRLRFKEKMIVRTSHLMADAITGNSKAGLSSYKVPHKKSYCIYNGFDLERTNKNYNPVKIRKKYGIMTNYVVSMFARMQYHKDYFTFINAAKKIIDANKDVTFLCVGGGPLLDKTKAIVDSAYKDKIRLLGQIENVDELMSITYISVLCTNSHKHKEGISNSILESLAFGVPVIATQGGGTDEIVKDNINGFLIEPNNPQMLYDRIIHLLQAPQQHKIFKNNAVNLVKKKFSLDVSSSQYINLYNSITHKPVIVLPQSKYYEK